KGYQVLSFDLPQHGDRKNNDYRCDIFNGIHDCKVIKEYVDLHWQNVYLFGCSLGACLSLYTYSNQNIKKCLFQSPIVNMEALIENMFIWFDISKQQLEKEKEIKTPIDILSWDYYCFIKEHPITEWKIPTQILYGALDNLQSRDVIDTFCNKFGCQITIATNSEHPFLAEDDKKILREWFSQNI
ncbi:MAG: alpha/beta hydrolase, partial [Coprobacillus sp.]